MLGRRPDSFEKPKLAKKPLMNLLWRCSLLRAVACHLFQRTSNSSSCNSPSPFASTWLMRLWISASDTCELPPFMSADLSSLAEIVPLPSWSSTLKASVCDMLGRRPDSFEKPKLAKKPVMNFPWRAPIVRISSPAQPVGPARPAPSPLLSARMPTSASPAIGASALPLTIPELERRISRRLAHLEALFSRLSCWAPSISAARELTAAADADACSAAAFSAAAWSAAAW